MIVRVIEPPAPIVTWQEAMEHVRSEDEEKKEYLQQLIAAAQNWIDGPSGWLGHSFGLQTLEMLFDGFPDEPLPYQPITEVVSVTYLDTGGVQQTVPGTDYRLLFSGAVHAESWPASRSGPETVAIRVRAGYPPRMVAPEGGGDPVPVSTVPAAVKQAVLLLVGHWYANRETVVVGTISAEVPVAAMSLLAPFRSWRG